MIEPSWFCGSMRAGQTFRISSQEYVRPVLRTFMLLSVAGKCSTTIYTSIFIPIVLISAKFLVAAMGCGRPLDHLTTHSLNVVCITSHDVYLKTYNSIISSSG